MKQEKEKKKTEKTKCFSIIPFACNVYVVYHVVWVIVPKRKNARKMATKKNVGKEYLHEAKWKKRSRRRSKRKKAANKTRRNFIIDNIKMACIIKTSRLFLFF